MGFQLEGVSMYDSGKWMVRIHHNEQWVTATFELVVTNFDITTDADLNISIEVGAVCVLSAFRKGAASLWSLILLALIFHTAPGGELANKYFHLGNLRSSPRTALFSG